MSHDPTPCRSTPSSSSPGNRQSCLPNPNPTWQCVTYFPTASFMPHPSSCSPAPCVLWENRTRVNPGPEDRPQPLTKPRPIPAQLTTLPAQAPTLSSQLVITALKCHKYDKNIQVTGSAALFYLTNSEYRSEQSVKLRRQVIQVVLNGMESYQEVTVSPLPTTARMLWPSHPLPTPHTPTSAGPSGAHLAVGCLLPSSLPTAALPDS